MGADGIAIGADGARLFYCPLGSRKLYSVAIDVLVDRSLDDWMAVLDNVPTIVIFETMNAVCSWPVVVPVQPDPTPTGSFHH